MGEDQGKGTASRANEYGAHTHCTVQPIQRSGRANRTLWCCNCACKPIRFESQ